MPSRGLRSTGVISENHPIEPPRDVFTYSSFLPRCISILTPPKELHEAKLQFEATGQASRMFKDFTYQTRKSWSRERRVVGKAEHLAKGSNPRFVVASLSAEELNARALYEDLYCARGEMENRIKEQQLCLFADRTSCATMRATSCGCGCRAWLTRC